MTKRYLTLGTILLGLIVVLMLGILFMQEPSGDRDWIEDQSHTTYIESTATSSLFHNVRDWTYDARGPAEKSWQTVAVDPNAIEQVWFFIDYFSPIEGIAHAFLSFEFTDGTTLVLSIEARREQDESYSPLYGAFRAYELSYVWSTERDMIARRLVAAENPVAMYPLSFTSEEAHQLLQGFIAETNELAETPKFYNTITGNCMNMLAMRINQMSPGRLPYGIAWNLPGYAGSYLMRHDLARESYDLTPFREEIAGVASYDPTAFSSELRALLPE